MLIEDETGKEKMFIRNGTIWVGMFALMEVVWSDGVYKLECVYDLGPRIDKEKTLVNEPLSAYRMLFVKGGFMSNEDKRK